MNKNLGYRIIAVLIATVLWVFVGVGSRFEMGKRKITVPIELKRVPETMVLKTVPAYADLVLEGPVRALDRLAAQDFAVSVDLCHRWQDDQPSFELNVDSPPGVKLAEIEPSRVKVVLQQEKKRKNEANQSGN